tara:strand:+ start:587 stop:859 length:273 start_codon:yes stop_codon:yes gene_type:complete
VQKGFDRAAAGQVELDAVFVLHHWYGQFEQLDDDRRGLSPRQLSALQQFGSQGVMQYVGGAGEKQAQVVGLAGAFEQKLTVSPTRIHLKP